MTQPTFSAISDIVIATVLQIVACSSVAPSQTTTMEIGCVLTVFNY
jgi:hypothetical protein